MNKKEFEKLMHEKHREQQLESLDANKNRAQSISIGTSASGTCEITMRGVNGSFLWEVYQPVQVTELIHQLAANIGCHINLQPRNDFGSWRTWREPTEQELEHLAGFPPFALQNPGSEKIGLIKNDQIAPALDPRLNATEQEHVATKKAVNKRTTKRTRKTS